MNRFLVAAALLWVYGTLGALDMEQISFARAAVQAALGTGAAYYFATVGCQRILRRSEKALKRVCQHVYFSFSAKPVHRSARAS